MNIRANNGPRRDIKIDLHIPQVRSLDKKKKKNVLIPVACVY